MTIRETAIAYHQAGLTVLPAIKAQKRPAVPSWKAYQDQSPTLEQVESWFGNPSSKHDGLCIVCGKTSGNLEVIDFDANGELFSAWFERIPPDLRDHLVVESTPSNGEHVIYRCQSPVSGNLKLAQRQDSQTQKITTLIETRGEGGLFLCDPTPGYELIQGDLCDLPVLTESEREILLQSAWELNEYIPPVINGPPPNSRAAYDGSIRPGDAFNSEADPRDILKQHGWIHVRNGNDGNEYWRRPGKNSGWSATLKDGAFYVFTVNAHPFESRKAYSPFSVYTLLEHGGDFVRAASALRAQGYGSPAPNTMPTPAMPATPPLSLVPLTVRQLMAKHPKLRKPILHGLLREGETMNMISAPKMGKALAIDTPILTETGWKTMGDLQPGMRVHTADGSLTTIVAVTDIMYGRPCYKVITRSGAFAVADAQHLWAVRQRNQTAVVTTDKLAEGHRGRRWLLPVADALERPSVALPLDPWVLGYWLGNGAAREGAISINNQDVAEVIGELRRAGFDPGKPAVRRGGTAFTVLGLRVILRRMGLLYGKSIPEQYLLASRSQRAALLAGLLDADGHAITQTNGTGAVEFTTTDQNLFFQTLMLIRSLGYKASSSVGRATLNGVDCSSKLRIQLAASRDHSPFRLHRRTAALPTRPISQRSGRDAVESVVPVASVPVKCIQVEHSSGLFLAGHDFMVTHNSWLATDLALAVSTGRDWLDTFPCERGNVLILDNELHCETSANRIPKVADARGIPADSYADRVSVLNLRGALQDVFTLGSFFQSIEPGRYKVIILDAFYRFMPRDMDENDNGTMASLYNHIDRYADQLACSFVLIHHSSKGNQSGKSVTDVGAGAGSQSRATDTHMILRSHEEEDAVVLDAAVRSWPPVSPCCLRWSYPVWYSANDLDPAQLRSEKTKKRGQKKDEWTAQSFIDAFVDDTPAVRTSIIAKAVDAGMSRWAADNLLRVADNDGLLLRHGSGQRNEPYTYQRAVTHTNRGSSM